MLSRFFTKQICVTTLVTLFALAGCDSDSNNNNSGSEPEVPKASAREARDADDLLEGPLARSSEGDYVLENDLLRVIIQKPGRNWFGLGTYGGNIIDVSMKNADGSFNPDHLEEFIIGINIENTANYTELRIENNGDDGNPAVICATGPDDLMEIFNASSAFRSLGASFPESADDRDLPIQIETCYSLAPEDTWVVIDTTLTNTDSEDLEIFLVENLNGSGEVEAFQPNAGFGEPLLTTACPEDTYVACDAGQCDQCNYLAYAGNGGAAGVSYGLIHEIESSSSFTAEGISILVLGESVINLVFGGAEPNFNIAANGELALRRFFAVGDGNASSISDTRNRIQGFATGELSGTVTSEGEALPNADVSVFRTVNGNTEPPTRFVVSHSSTDEQGNYNMTLPPGDYQVQAHLEGYLYASDEPAAISVAAETVLTQDFDLPAPGYLHVDVTETLAGGGTQSVPAKLQLVGFDPSPPLKNNVLGAETGVFGDDADRLPYGVTLVEFIDRNGSSNVSPVEPGDYQVVVSRGPRYSAFRQDISITSGQTTEIQAEIVQVVDTPDLISADFHVHSIDSADSEVTREERVATYLSEGVDFFTPSDHGIRTDFTETIMSMDVADLIGTAPNAEITTFDYGHFNSWPVTLDSNRLSNGSVDWGREAPPGEDFPAYGNFGLSPEEIITAALDDPLDNIVQINHISWYFGTDNGGLLIDTGLTPPQSQVDLTQRRLDPGLENAFDDGFQSLEVWIGTDGRAGIFDEFLGQNAGDWFNLINQGIVRTGMANSDTHDRRITFLATRNLIASDETDPGQLSTLAEQLAATVAAGKNVGTNAPAVSITASARYLGIERIAGLGIDEETLVPISSGGTARVVVEISTASWAPVDSVDFYINNQPEKTSATSAAARYGVCADFTVSAGDPAWESEEVVVVEGVEGASRTEITATLEIEDITEDTWVIAVAKGTDGVSSPMFPIVPEDLDPATNQSLEDLLDDNLGEGGIPAFAFTNPLFIDVGNNGWSPPGVANAPCAP